MTSKHDFKEVLEAFPEPDFSSKETLGAFLDAYRVELVAALRIADALMQEPSEGMLAAARDWSLTKYGQGVGDDGAIGCFKAMRDQLLREVGDE